MTKEEKILRKLLDRLNDKKISLKDTRVGTFHCRICETETNNEFYYEITIFYNHPMLNINPHTIMKYRSGLSKYRKDIKDKWIDQVWSAFLTEFYHFSVFGLKVSSPHGITGTPIVSVPIKELALQEEESVRFINENI